jgi:hypothetical protein
MYIVAMGNRIALGVEVGDSCQPAPNHCIAQGIHRIHRYPKLCSMSVSNLRLFPVQTANFIPSTVNIFSISLSFFIHSPYPFPHPRVKMYK